MPTVSCDKIPWQITTVPWQITKEFKFATEDQCYATFQHGNLFTFYGNYHSNIVFFNTEWQQCHGMAAMPWNGSKLQLQKAL